MGNVIDLRPKIDKQLIKEQIAELRKERIELAVRFREVRRELSDIAMALDAIDYELESLKNDLTRS
jgi:hypothetical protein